MKNVDRNMRKTNFSLHMKSFRSTLASKNNVQRMKCVQTEQNIRCSKSTSRNLLDRNGELVI